MSVADQRPTADECEAYYFTYIDCVPAGAIVDRLREQARSFADGANQIGPEAGDLSYAPGKWTVKQVIGHMWDTEAVFGYRALAIARGDNQPIPGMDQDLWIDNGPFTDLALEKICQGFLAQRRASIAALTALNDEAWIRTGVASGFSFTARSIAWILAGHELHHRKILAERYGLRAFA